MATRRKAKTKAKTKRKKARVTKAAARRKTAAKRTGAIRKKTAKKAPVKRASSKRARPAAKVAVKSTRRPPARPAAAPAPAAPAQAAPREERIGVVTHYYNHLSVAIVRLESGHLHVGDTIHIRGHTTDFTQRVESLEVEHAAAAEVGPNDDFGLKVAEHAREHDVVYKVLRP
jgi:Elongation factor Tu domain 2